MLPSATEILAAVGGLDLLVGRSHECDYPVEAARLPVLTSQKITATDPREIDLAVRAELAGASGSVLDGAGAGSGGSGGGQSLYRLDEDLLAALKPDVILTQDLCEVCSIDLASVQRIASKMANKPRVVSLNPHTVEDILDDHVRVGEAVGREAQARNCVVALRERLFAAGEYVNPFDDGPHLALLEWTDPIFIAGHWTVQLVERAGASHQLHRTSIAPGNGAAAGPQHGERKAGTSFVVDFDTFFDSDPQWIVIAPCGFKLDAAMRAAHGLAKHPRWNSLRAVKNKQVAVVDGNQYFNRPGPRIVDAFEWLVGWLNGQDRLIPKTFEWRLFHQG